MTGIFYDSKEAVERAEGLLEAAVIHSGANASRTPNDAVVAEPLHSMTCGVAGNTVDLHQFTVGRKAFREVPEIKSPAQLMLELSPQGFIARAINL